MTVGCMRFLLAGLSNVSGHNSAYETLFFFEYIHAIINVNELSVDQLFMNQKRVSMRN